VGTNLDGANLSGANLSNATVTEGALDSATTAGANLRGIRWVSAVPVVTLSFTFAGTIFCSVIVQLDGFMPNTTYPTRYFTFGIYSPGLDGTITTDSVGGALFSPFSFNAGAPVEVFVGDVSSGATTVAC
jgi:hypothetical protein